MSEVAQDNIQVELSIDLKPKHLNSGLREVIINKLREKYLHKLHKNFIIKNFDTNIGYTTMDAQGTVFCAVTVTEYLKYEIGQTVKGTISLKNSQPEFLGDCIKLTIEGVTRQTNSILTISGQVINNNAECYVTITELLYISGMIYKGSCVILESTTTTDTTSLDQ